MRRFSYLFVLVLAAMLALPATVGAAGRTPVDPSIMQPALNPAFTWTCWRMDDKTMCDGELHDSWTALDIGVPCAGGTIYSTGTQDQTLRRWGDAEGLALHTHGTGDISETLALNPDRYRAVRSGLQRYIVRPGRRCDLQKQARMQNPDKDEVPGFKC